MTPLKTLIFDFHQVISTLTTPTTTPSLVKTSLKRAAVESKRNKEIEKSKQQSVKKAGLPQLKAFC